MIDKIERKILYILKSISLLLLLLFFQYIPLLLFKINLEKISINNKIIYSLICDIMLIIIFVIIYKKDIINNFKNYFNKNIKKNLKISIKYWLIGFGIMIATNIIITTITNGAIPQNEESVRTLINKFPLYMLFELAIYAPLTEEIIFRKSIKDIIDNKYIYSITSGLIFGLMHIIGTIKTPTELIFILPYASLGTVFALLYHKTNNIFSTITIHSIHNTLTLILYLTLK